MQKLINKKQCYEEGSSAIRSTVQLLKDLMAEQAVSVDELSEKLNISKQDMNKILSCKYDIDLRLAIDIFFYLGHTFRIDAA